jgi:uncharacterized protein
MLQEKEIQQLVQKIVSCMDPDKVIMFGSHAKGKATTKSDLDLLIIKDTHLPMPLRNDDLKPILCKLLVGVDAHVYTPEEVEEYGLEEYSFIHSVLKTGRTMYVK